MRPLPCLESVPLPGAILGESEFSAALAVDPKVCGTIRMVPPFPARHKRIAGKTDCVWENLRRKIHHSSWLFVCLQRCGFAYIVRLCALSRVSKAQENSPYGWHIFFSRMAQMVQNP
jgi:hypothetical protein